VTPKAAIAGDGSRRGLFGKQEERREDARREEWRVGHDVFPPKADPRFRECRRTRVAHTDN